MREGYVVWITGLSASGKSTLTEELIRHMSPLEPFVLDGDEVRRGLCSDLGYSQNDRTENVRRVAEVARLASMHGIPTLVSLISPLQSQRELARKIVGGRFYEIYLYCPIDLCAKRDQKGLYKRAMAGELPDFTGVSSPYEEPVNPDLKLDSSAYPPAWNAHLLWQFLLSREASFDLGE